MVFVLLQITVVTFLPFNLQIADIKQLANTTIAHPLPPWKSPAAWSTSIMPLSLIAGR